MAKFEVTKERSALLDALNKAGLAAFRNIEEMNLAMQLQEKMNERPKRKTPVKKSK